MSIGGGQSNFAANSQSATLILGADAQALSWSFVATDFPYLAASDSDQARAISGGMGDRDLLAADVLKVSHHASKHGVNLELVERINPAVTIISSTANGPSYGFPHTVSQELIREALDPVAGRLSHHGKPRDHRADEALGIFYTCDRTDAAGNPPAGSLAVITKGQRRELWRFSDAAKNRIDFDNARRWKKPAHA
jgi:hypothetical protein